MTSAVISHRDHALGGAADRRRGAPVGALVVHQVLEVRDHHDRVARGDPEDRDEADQRAEREAAASTPPNQVPTSTAITPPASATGTLARKKREDAQRARNGAEQQQDSGERRAQPRSRMLLLGLLALLRGAARTRRRCRSAARPAPRRRGAPRRRTTTTSRPATLQVTVCRRRPASWRITSRPSVASSSASSRSGITLPLALRMPSAPIVSGSRRAVGVQDDDDVGDLVAPVRLRDDRALVGGLELVEHLGRTEAEARERVGAGPDRDARCRGDRLHEHVDRARDASQHRRDRGRLRVEQRRGRRRRRSRRRPPSRR